MSQHWAAISEAGAVSGMRFMVWVNKYLGRFVFSVILVPVMVYYFLVRRTPRRASMDFLRRVTSQYPEIFGQRPLAWLSFRHFLAFGHSLLDKYLVWVEPPTTIAMRKENEEFLLGVVNSGRGCLILASHFGNLEYSRGLAYRHPDLVINVLLYDRHAMKFAELMQKSEPDSRHNLIQVTDLDIDVALQLKAKIDRGEWLVIAGDRIPLGESGQVSHAQFFGDQAKFPIGPYVLANLLGCPVYLFHCFKQQGEHYLVMEDFAERIRLERADRQKSLNEWAQQYATALERQVVQSPLQWFNFFDFWEDRPEERETV
jgi:predicted LPLAT superfamily acyltransferase